MRIEPEIHDYTAKPFFQFHRHRSYKKVKTNMTGSKIPYQKWDKSTMEEFATRLSGLNRDWGWNLELGTCGANT